MPTATGLRATGRTKDGRYQIRSGNRLVYRDSWDAMSPEEQEWFQTKYPNGSRPVVEQAPARTPASTNRYQGRINWYEQRIAVLESIVKDPRESADQRARAANDISQYRAGIEVLTEAGGIPEDETAWFVTSYGEFKVQIPPVVPGEYDRRQHAMSSADHYYYAKDPVEIAALRRAARLSTSDIHEKPAGTFPIIDYARSQFEGWGTSDLYMARQAKRYRSVT